MVRELVRLIVPMMAAFISIAFYYSANGVQGDPFSLNVFTVAFQHAHLQRLFLLLVR